MKNFRFSFNFFILFISFDNFSEEDNSLSAIDCDNTEFVSEKPIYAETEEEKIRRLEKELERALTQFDNCIVEENKVLEDSGGGAAASASTTMSGEDKSENVEESSVTSSDSSSPLKSTDPDGGNGLDKSISPQLSSSNGSIPKDIPLKGDDDIVAQQLRELAMAEKDSILREQLWDKYREYVGIKKENKNE